MRIFTSLTVLFIAFLINALPGLAQEDLKISLSASHVNANPGDEVTYIIKYSNAGITPASNVIITDHLSPSGLYTYVSSSPSGTVSGNTITWDQAQIQELASLGNGEFQIAVTVKAGVAGNGVTQYTDGYYISSSPSMLENYATITSNGTFTPVQSNIVSTKLEQISGVHINNASGVIKSSTNTMVYYLIQVTNSGNVYDRYDLSSINYDCDGPGGRKFETLTASFSDQNGNAITRTDWIAPDQTYYFLLKLTTDPGTSPGRWSCHDVSATSNISGITGIGTIQTQTEGSPQYPYVSLSKIDTKDPVQAGDIFTYTIYAFNSNNSYAANNFVVKENYPPNITFISATPAPDPGFNNQWTLGSLNYGLAAAKTITITARVNPLNNCSGNMTNTVFVTYDGYDPANPPTASVVTAIKSYPDLVITKSAECSPTPAQKGGTITYTINYQNAGTCDAPNSQIKDLFDDVHTNIINAGGGVQSGNEISWNLGLLTPGQSGTITYTVLIDPASTVNPGTTYIAGKATISTSETESNYNNNSAITSIPVTVLPDMKVEIIPDNQTLDAGTEYSYTLKVTNIGDIAATNVEIKNMLPAGLTIGTVSDGGVNAGGSISLPVIPTFAVGNTVEYQVKITPSCLLIPSFTSIATVTSSIIDKDETNNSVTVNPIVQDLIIPVLTNVPPDITVSCDAIPALGTPAATDNCDGAPVVYYLGEASTKGANPLMPDYYNYTLTRSWEAVDASGNHSLKGTQVITVEDVTLPETPVLADITVGECSGTPVAPTTTDNCKGTITGTTSTMFPITTQGTTVVAWSFDDGNGNVTTTNQNVIVKDITAPVPDIASLPEITGECNAVVIAAPTATDNCSGVLTATTTDPLTHNVQGTYTIHWTYDDGNGNTAVQTQTVIVDDVTAPVPDVVVLPAVTGECNATVSAAPTATDNCSGALTATTTDPLTYSEQGTYTVNWSYDDGNGNIAIQTQTVIVDDVTAPVPDVAVLPAITGECSATAVSVPTATDNCSGVLTATTTDPLTYDVQGTYTIHWTYDDGNGNTAVQTQTVIVDDITAPEMPILADVTVGECSGTPVAPTTTDNCKGTITGTTSTMFPITTQGTTVVAWSFDDGNGNVTTTNQNVIVKDITAPVPDIASLPEITGECNAVVIAAPTATDNCSGVLTATTTDPLTYSEQGTYTIHWTYNDGNGNISTQTQTVIVDDITAPETPILADVTVGECSGTPVAPTTTDNCKGMITGTTSTVFPITTQGTTVVTWTFDDGNGNVTTANQNVMVDDVTAPVPDIALLPTISEECSATVTAPTATDNCSGVLTATTTDPLTYDVQGTYTIHWTYNDGNENISTQTQTVVVDDITAPVPDVAVLPSITGQYSATAIAPTATDNCLGIITATTIDPTTYNIQGIYTIHWTFDDGNGNISTQDQTVVVDDTTSPETPVLADVTVGECSGTPVAPTTTDDASGVITGTTSTVFPITQQGTTVVTWTFDDGNGNVTTANQNVMVDDVTAPVPDIATLPDITGKCSATAIAPTATDNCSGVITAATSDPTTYVTQGTYIIHWVYDDGNGNTAFQTQTVIVDDVTDPVPDVVSLPVLTGECSATATAVPTATDDCSGIITGTTTDPLTYDVQGTYTIHWTFDDGNGNISTQEQMVVVDDVTSPETPVLADVTVGECSGTPVAPTTTDNCKGTITGATSTVFPITTQGTTVVTWTFDDGNGNVTTANQNVIVEDVTVPLPDIATLPDITGECSATATVPTATDNCQGEITATTTDPLIYNVQGTYTIHWTYDDGNGNIATQTQTVVVDDVTSPETPVLADVIVGECSGTPVAPTTTDNCKGTITGTTSTVFPLTTQGTTVVTWTFDDGNGNVTTANQNVIVDNITTPVPDFASLPVITGECSATVIVAPTATSNCSGTITATTADPLTYDVQGSYTIHWTYNDGNGNISTQTQTVIVDDITAPEMPILADVTVGECSGTPVAPTTTDNCKGMITGTTSTVFPITTQGTTVVTWTFDDGNGNVTTANQNVMVDDVTAPVSDIPVLPTITGQYSATATSPTATDNCSGIITGVTTDPMTYTVQGTYTIHWTYNDGNGNIATQTQTVIVDDTTPPFVPVLADLNVGECSGTPEVPTTTDNTSEIITGTTTTVFPLTTQGTTVVTWTFDDGHGNVITANQNVIVDDVTAPVADVIELSILTGECSVTATVPTATDNCKGEITATTTDPLTYNVQGTYTIHWTYDDGNGNISTQTQTVIVDDITAPEMPILADVTVGECSGTPVAPTTTDNCKGTITGTTSTVFPITIQGTTVVTWTFDDGNGNVIIANQNVIVDNITTPIPDFASLPVITGECSATVIVAPTATSNCSGTITATTTDPLTYDVQGTYTIHWTYDDGNGNIATQTQTVIVDDTTAPLPDFASLPVISGECSATVIAAPTATDNCKGRITAITSDPLSYSVQGTYTIHWIFDDGNGNTSIQTQTVIIDDITPPETPVLADVYLGECSGTPPTPTTMDHCAGIVKGTTPILFPKTKQGKNTIIWTFDDGNGNITTAYQNLILDDVTAPVPDVASLPEIIGECMVTATAPTATDNCKGKITATTTDPLSYDIQGTYTIHWIFDDGNGNTSTQTQKVVVDDITPPETPVLADVYLGECSGTPPTPITMDHCAGIVKGTTSILFPKTKQGKNTILWTFDDGNGNITTAYQNLILDDVTAPVPDVASLPELTEECIATVIAAPTATDNCKGKIIATTSDPLTYDVQGTYTIRWVYDDGNGNTSTQTQKVVVKDNTAPITPVLADVTVGKCNGTPIAPTTTDNCNGTITGTTSTVFPISTQGITIVTWTFDDGNGNVTTASQKVMVADITPPEITGTIAPTTVEGCSPEGITPPVNTVAELEAMGLSINDACTADKLLTVTSKDVPSGIRPITITRTYTITDASNNSADYAQTIIVADTQKPTIQCPQDLNVTADAGTCDLTSLELGIPITNDNCSVSSVSNDAPLLFKSGTTIVTWTVVDESGNTATCQQKIHVNGVPVAMDDKFVMDENSKINGNVIANDKGLCDTPILIDVTSEPEFGRLTYTVDGNFEYTPDGNYFGKDKFTYQVCDSDDDCTSATVEITINDMNEQPLSNADTEDLQVDVILHGDVAVNDVPSSDGSNVWSLVTPPSNGSILFNQDGTYTYTPHTSFIGDDRFSYKLCDANGDCSTTQVSIHVEDVLLPNQILTPNADGNNDTFIITGIEFYPVNKVTIYNRWGSIVYRKNNYQNEWDGNSNLSKVGSNALPVGTYFYLVDYGNDRHKTGFVYLDR